MMSAQEAILHNIVGTRPLLNARAHVEHHEVSDIRWDAKAGRAYGRVRGAATATVSATVSLGATGELTSYEGACTCGDPQCAHPIALVILALDGQGAAVAPTAPRTRRRTSRWESAVAGLVGAAADPPPAGAPAEAGIALQFELAASSNQRRSQGPDQSRRIALRPVLRGNTGWVRSGINWSNLGYAFYGRTAPDQRHRRLLNEIRLLSVVDEQHYYGYGKQAIYLDEFASRRIWDLLAEAVEIGLPLVQAGKTAGPVTVGRTSVRVSVRVERIDGALTLSPELTDEGVPVAPECAVLVGQPAHGIGWWGVRGEPEPTARDRVLRLAPLAAPLDSGIAQALTGAQIVIPPRDERRFVQDYYVPLARQVELVGAAEAALPGVGAATLAVNIDPAPGHGLALTWQWLRLVGDQRHGEPLYSPAPAGEAADRDRLVRQVTQLVGEHTPDLLESSPTGARLAAAARTSADGTIQLVRELLPRLTELDGVEVVLAPGLAYRELAGPAEISFEDSGSTSGTDWFDLAVHVEVAGEQIPFEQLFVALAEDRKYVILPSGAYLGLDRPQFHQLRQLIEEARSLSDAPPGQLRVGRFQAGMWQELAELGEITGQARAWQESVRALYESGGAAPPSAPSGLRAVLRPYQRDGFEWLATLYRHGLGGILADDMGLGKTVQALALICHARETTGSAAPFLVVAPASVVGTWAHEAATFTPDLTVRAVTQTQTRRGASLSEVAAGADLVVTSYTLFRLEQESYQALKWDGLMLDEAQFIKNHQAQAHRHAKRVPAPFKLAITGTPLENNLAELWSLLSVTAPGLFPRLDRFTEYYRRPIEKGRDTDRLAQLRRRVAPLLLRRRKTDVAADLPAKQEQVIELELDRKHRRVYQTYLQRERQKVLGLLGEFERNRFEIFRSLTLLRQASLDVRLVDPDQDGVPSTKLDLLAELATNLAAEGHRSLVFSQFTRFLRAARTRLEGMGLRCCYLDGKTRDRPTVLEEFRSGDAPFFLISLKAGGFGLNLTEADYCILLDPWWNPAAEEQAVDRVHRIGQTRNVMVYRLVAKDTIEAKVMALKARKAELFSSVLDGGDFATAQLTAADIRGLLE